MMSGEESKLNVTWNQNSWLRGTHMKRARTVFQERKSCCEVRLVSELILGEFIKSFCTVCWSLGVYGEVKQKILPVTLELSVVARA